MSFGFSAHSLFLFPRTFFWLGRETASSALRCVSNAFTEIFPFTSNFLFCSLAEDYIPRPLLPITHIADAVIRKDTSAVSLIVCCGQIMNLAKILSSDGAPLPLPVSCHIAVKALWFLSCAYKGYKTARIAGYRFSHTWKNRELPTTSKVLTCASSVLALSISAYTITSAALDATQFVEGYRIFLTLDNGQQEHVLKYDAIHLLGGEKACSAVHMDRFHYQKLFNFGARPSYVNALYENCHVRGYNVKSTEDFCEALSEATAFFRGPIDFLSLFSQATSHSMSLSKTYKFTGSSIELACMNSYLAKNAQILLAGSNTANSKPVGASHLNLEHLIKDDYDLYLMFKNRLNYKHLTELIANQLPGRIVTGFTTTLYPLPFLGEGSSTSNFITWENPFPETSTAHPDWPLLE